MNVDITIPAQEVTIPSQDVSVDIPAAKIVYQNSRETQAVLSAVQSSRADLSQPSGRPQGTQAPHELQDGTIVKQGGVSYRKQGDSWVPVQ